MKKTKKFISALLTITLLICTFASCGLENNHPTRDTSSVQAESGESINNSQEISSKEEKEEEQQDSDSVSTDTENVQTKTNEIRGINCNNNVSIWSKLAGHYYNTGTGNKMVKITTIKDENHDERLVKEMNSSEPPTFFIVSSPAEVEKWSDYCYDLKDSAIYKNLKSDDFAVIENGNVKGVAFNIDTYGIIYNKTLLESYFQTDGAKAKNVDEINNFDKFKAVVEDIQSKKDKLGIKGAFTSSGMDLSSAWRFNSYLANLPVYYEYKSDGIYSTKAIKGTYLDNFKSIWDLYINNATCEPAAISDKTDDEAAYEFCLGEAVFYQNATWVYQTLIDNGMTDEELGMLPIFFGADGEENQGLCTGSESFICVNKNASKDAIQETLNFLEWVITDEDCKYEIINIDHLAVPFKTFDDEKSQSENALIRIANEYITNGKKSIAWYISTFPSDTWKSNLGEAMTSYARGGSWDEVKKAFVDGWKSEYEINL